MGIDMEAEKLLEQNGFSKFYESKNVVGFVSMRDRLKFYEDTQTICLYDSKCTLCDQEKRVELMKEWVMKDEKL